ncbi:hypothetical protein [Lacticigenium naphthae]|uniref:hypothetical protein n=1 Tax=Lacticigenium naphthae TaxID=515351 RepID=UPI00041EC0D5|nr:hypothetical protein [Lacticigenium naphthae]
MMLWQAVFFSVYGFIMGFISYWAIRTLIQVIRLDNAIEQLHTTLDNIEQKNSL